MTSGSIFIYIGIALIVSLVAIFLKETRLAALSLLAVLAGGCDHPDPPPPLSLRPNRRIYRSWLYQRREQLLFWSDPQNYWHCLHLRILRPAMPRRFSKRYCP